MTRTNEEDAQVASLGLTADATSEEVASARAAVDDFLSTAPDELRSWADLQSRRTHDALDAFDDPLGAPAKVPAQTGRPRGNKRRTVTMLAVLVAVGALVGIYFSGGGGAQTASMPADTSQMQTASVDDAEVQRLMAELAAHPDDIEIMRNLGKVYYAGGDMVMAGQWQERILELSPEDVDALLALGVAKLNIGDTVAAEKYWSRVTELNPDLPEVYYNLGFLYFSKAPPEPEKAQEAWAKVVELAPDSSMADTVKNHLESGLGGTTPLPEKTP